jgi:hypothetical protein
VDLHPSGFDDSIAQAIAGNRQVGWAWGRATQSREHAILWNGTAESAVDLHQFLIGLPVSIVRSYAYGVDSHGNIVGYGKDRNNNSYAILWSPIPEPSTSGILFCCTIAAGFYERRPTLARAAARRTGCRR